MKSANFPEATRRPDRPDDMTEKECSPRAVWTDGRMCVSLWRPSWRERLSTLLFGKVWLFVVSGSTQPPVAVEAARTVFEDVYRPTGDVAQGDK